MTAPNRQPILLHTEKNLTIADKAAVLRQVSDFRSSSPLTGSSLPVSVVTAESTAFAGIATSAGTAAALPTVAVVTLKRCVR